MANSSVSGLTVTNNIGKFVLGACYQVGNIYFLGFSITNDNAVAVGQNAVSATISGLPTGATLMPSSAVYAGETCYVVALNGTTLTARVTGSAHTASYTAYGTLILLAS